MAFLLDNGNCHRAGLWKVGVPGTPHLEGMWAHVRSRPPQFLVKPLAPPTHVNPVASQCSSFARNCYTGNRTTKFKSKAQPRAAPYVLAEPSRHKIPTKSFVFTITLTKPFVFTIKFAKSFVFTIQHFSAAAKNCAFWRKVGAGSTGKQLSPLFSRSPSISPLFWPSNLLSRLFSRSNFSFFISRATMQSVTLTPKGRTRESSNPAAQVFVQFSVRSYYAKPHRRHHHAGPRICA
jgi:hypothetical protein